jgi:hypothetical protein
MRSPPPFILALLAIGWHAASPLPSQAQAVGPVAIPLDSVAAVVLERGIGGWGNGADYSFRFNMTGLAEYHGGLRSVFKGDYQAVIDSPTVVAVRRLVRPGALQYSKAFCFDATTAFVRLILIDSSRVEVAAGCAAPEENVRVAAALDSLGGQLRWQSISAVPPNRRLKLAGGSAGLRYERLGLSRSRSLTGRTAWCTFAPAA